MTLSDALSRICPGNIQTAQAARQRFSDLAILPRSLGLLEDTVVRLAALQGSTQPLSSPKRTVIFCADNGVTAEGVTPSPSYMTAAQAVNFARGGGVINVFSRRAEAPVLVVDVGIAVPYWEPRIRVAFVRKGTDNIVRGPAMTREECLHTLETGISLAAEAAADGIRVAIPGEMGIGNTTTTGAVASVLLGIPPEELVPHGSAGEAGAAHKAEVIRRALAVNRPDPSDPLDILAKVGGLDLAALCGFFLGCAALRIAAMVDGVISAAAALCAVRMAPAARACLFPSHRPAERAGVWLLEALELSPLLDAGLHLGEGTGGALGAQLLDNAVAAYNETAALRELEGMVLYG